MSDPNEGLVSEPESGFDGATMAAPVTFVAIDNHHTILRAFQHLAASQPDRIELQGTFAHAREVDYSAPAPAVVVLDLYLGRDSELSTPWIPKLTAWGAQVLLHTSSETPVPLREAVAAGATGLALKNDMDTDLVAVIERAARGEFICSSALAYALLEDRQLSAALSEREVELARGLAAGLTMQQIASRQRVSYETAKGYLKNLRRKYLDLGRDITNSHSIVREAGRDGWIDRP